MYLVYRMTNLKSSGSSEEPRRERALPPMEAWRAWILLLYKSVELNFFLTRTLIATQNIVLSYTIAIMFQVWKQAFVFYFVKSNMTRQYIYCSSFQTTTLLQMDRKFLENLRSDEQPANTRVTVLCKQGAVSFSYAKSDIFISERDDFMCLIRIDWKYFYIYIFSILTFTQYLYYFLKSFDCSRHYDDCIIILIFCTNSSIYNHVEQSSHKCIPLLYLFLHSLFLLIFVSLALPGLLFCIKII